MQTPIINISTELNDIPNFIAKSTMSSTLWFTGCQIGCEGCHNQILKEKQEGLQLEDLRKELKKRSELTDWFVFLGGEPFNDHDSCFALYSLLMYVKTQLGKKTFVYSGYNKRQVSKRIYDYLDCHKMYLFIDYIKYGKFDLNYSKDKFENSDDYFFATVNQELRTGKGALVYSYDFELRESRLSL